MQALDSNGIPKIQDNKPVSVGQEIMDHCMITALSATGKSGSFLDAENFVSALLDKITILPAKPGTNVVQLPPKDIGEYITAIEKSDVISGELKRTILSFAHQAVAAANIVKNIPGAATVTNNISSEIKSDLDQFRERLESWFNTNSDRLTGTFKRKKVLPSTFILATVLTVGLNADTIDITKYLYDHKEETKVFADKAINSLDQYKDRIDTIRNRNNGDTSKNKAAVADLNANLDSIKADVARLKGAVPKNLPLGWDGTVIIGWKKIFGWLATILAICMGAPFWFDLLNKIANLRGAGPKPVVADDPNKK